MPVYVYCDIIKLAGRMEIAVTIHLSMDSRLDYLEILLSNTVFIDNVTYLGFNN